MALTGRAALLALASVLAVALLTPSWAGVLGWNLALVVLVGLDALLAPSPRRLELSRTGDAAVRLGSAAATTLTVRAPAGRRVTGLLRDAWPPSAGASPRTHRLDVPAGGAQRCTTDLLPTRRGDRRADRVTVRTRGPLGLAARQRSLEVPGVLRALPPFASRRHLPGKLAQLREIEGRDAVLVRGQGTEADAHRAYVPGDDVRSIDWRGTARAGTVVVRTWRPERGRHVVLVLDTGRASAGRVGDAPRLDAALDAALLLAALAAAAGDRVSLLAHASGPRARVTGSTGPALLPALVQAMAPLEPELVDADLAGAVRDVLTSAPQRALVVLLTGLDRVRLEEGLLPALPPLLRRHAVLVAAVADPRVEQLARGRGDAAAVYAAAAAERSLAERRRLAALLERQGVTAVDAPPDRLAPALADAYLALKAAGRL
ncbi:uncharacterized protein (DUF58 family) [Motilibacter rhizosphaerae]|uniref:Uncharacterized protein (DUF58 family) n=1 Tax=Motilibacter rhizosphaerae TaxID=598652 RepID=A0A4Q7NSX0_9ACTN|nr:DUF58 domain-containing protein [Motilibacter rhizosphaerae]RZS90145.1 uncharacterized protein (DUF58 family) [Motilibacter rhizosphaerae]